MNSHGYPTTRRHPRSLAEAFPDERACAIERPAPRRFDPVPWVAAVGLVGFLVLLFAGRLG